MNNPRRFICPVTETPCRFGDCLATRCIIQVEQREEESAARWRAEQAEKQWRLSHPSLTTLADLMDDE